MAYCGYPVVAKHSVPGTTRMKEHTQKLLDKAVDVLEAADALLTVGKVNVAAGRAYYGMMRIAEALLNEKGLNFDNHGDIHGAYGLHFAKTKALDPKFHRWLLDSFDHRIVGDYDVDADFGSDMVADMINQAYEFLEAARTYLKAS
ncbi:MAG: DNA-binding protein [Anaerolineae bacterium CG03_land_8_20_14_0_80_58_20]|nr:MAG: DNA-binding protein [Anaerolineae bacterium CG03_land_8_20_14_0_80_58_20]